MASQRAQKYQQEKDLMQMQIGGRSADKQAELASEEQRAQAANEREYEKMRKDAFESAYKEQGLDIRHKETMMSQALDREERMNGHIVDATARKEAAEFTFAGQVVLQKSKQEFEAAKDNAAAIATADENLKKAIIELAKTYPLDSQTPEDRKNIVDGMNEMYREIRGTPAR
jgi:phosphohistidine swiveling domain-containing protein